MDRMVVRVENEPRRALDAFTAILGACHCHSRRLAVWEKHDSSISRVEDPAEKVSGPGRVKERAPLESSDATADITASRFAPCRRVASASEACDGTRISKIHRSLRRANS